MKATTLTSTLAASGLSLARIVLHGSECSRRTGWQTWAGFTMVHFANGTSKYLGEVSHNAALAAMRAAGVDCADYDRKAAEWEKAHSYPPKPENVELYQHNYGADGLRTQMLWGILDRLNLL